MHPRHWLTPIWVSWLAVLLLASVCFAEGPDELFELRVRPILVGVCARCHGSQEQSSGLRLDSRAALLAGGSRGPAVVPGDAAGSLLVRAVRRTDPELCMPPDGNAPLDADAVAALKTWIDSGAPWPAASAVDPRSAHWAFAPLADVSPPEVPGSWSDNPIDRFIAAGHRAHGLRPAPPADRPTLLRRVTFDLTGLPPTPEEIALFVTNERPDAWERVIDRLLASPRYGERWGRYWMDVVRYADTAGDNADYPIPEARLYRDYIIDSFNADKPFDTFVREQVAGDLLADPSDPATYAERIVATGFIALSRRYLTAPYEQHHLTIEDTLDTLGRTFLGLTLRCARCHDHKFDPITTEDYYALYGMFSSTQYPWAGAEEFSSKHIARMNFAPLVPRDSAAYRAGEQRQAALAAQIESIERHGPLSQRLEKLAARIAELEHKLQQPEQGPSLDELRHQLDALRQAHQAATQDQTKQLAPLRAELEVIRRRGLPPGVPGAYALHEGTPADAAVQQRGDPAQPGKVVPRDVPRALAPHGGLTIPPGQSGRRQLADWLASPDNALVARVIVNRVWQHHFGRGIVATPSNFGRMGSPPSHPELLDWLARWFIDSGWSIKRLHRLIVTSRAYQLSAANDPICGAADPENEWRWRCSRRRLDAEAIRDGMMFVAGNLDLARPGEHPFPPIAEWGWTQHNPFKAVYAAPCRSVYLMTQRIQRHPFLALFDGPDPNVSTDVRTQANIPLQALYLMNDPFVAEQAAGFARRLLSEPEPDGRVSDAIEAAWGRRPSAAEAARVRAYVADYQQRWAAAGLPQQEQELAAWVSLARVLMTSSEFVYVE